MRLSGLLKFQVALTLFQGLQFCLEALGAQPISNGVVETIQLVGDLLNLGSGILLLGAALFLSAIDNAVRRLAFRWFRRLWFVHVCHSPHLPRRLNLVGIFGTQFTGYGCHISDHADKER